MSWTFEDFTGGDKVSSQTLGDLVTGKKAEPGAFESFWMGLKKSGLDTVQGVDQLATWAAGSPERQAKVDQAIREAEARYGPSMDTMSGKLGYVLGTVGQFMVPHTAAAKVASAFPKVAAAVPKLFTAAKELALPSTVTRAAGGGAAFEATRPTPEGSEDLLTQRGIAAVEGAGGGALGGGAGKLMGAYTKPLEGGARELAEDVVRTAKEVGSPPLLYGQIRQTPMVRIIEEGASITPGAAGAVREVVQPQREFLHKTAAEALGGTASRRPTGVAIEDAWKKALAEGYEPFSKAITDIKPTGIEKRYFTRMGKDAVKQYATPQGQAAARIVSKDVLGTPGTAFSGDRIIDRLQYFRDLLSDPGIDVSAKEEIRLIQKDFESWARRSAERKYGPDAIKLFDNLDTARQKLSNIHRIRQAVEPETGAFSPAKFTRADVKGSPGRAAGTQEGDLKELAAVSRLAQMTRSPIGSSGTTERWMGSRVLNALSSPLAAIGAAGATGAALGEGLEEQVGYGAGMLLGSRAIGKAITSDILRRNAIKGFPRLNKLAERLSPIVVGAGEAVSQ